MEFWRAVVTYSSGASFSFVSVRGCVREWVAWHLGRGASLGVVSSMSGVRSVADLSSGVWSLLWYFRRSASGAVVWSPAA